jgi:hypothetical protein
VEGLREGIFSLVKKTGLSCKAVFEVDGSRQSSHSNACEWWRRTQLTALCCAVLCCAVLCCAVLYCRAVLCSTAVLYSTLQLRASVLLVAAGCVRSCFARSGVSATQLGC